MNKRGWIKIVEAFISILIIVSVILIVYNNESKNSEDLSSKIYPIQVSVLRDIELDPLIREKVLEIPKENLPLEQESFGEYGLDKIVNKINEKVPTNWQCVAKLCNLDGNICELKQYVEKDIYAQSVSIVADSSTYNPKQIKLFCYIK